MNGGRERKLTVEGAHAHPSVQFVGDANGVTRRVRTYQRMANALEDAGLAAEMARLADALRSRRPELDRQWVQARLQA